MAMVQLKQLKQTAIVPLDTLQNWELNPRSIKADRFAELKKRITEHGFNDVLKLAADGKTVIGGNMRLRALRELGFSEIQVLYTEAESPEDILRIALDDNEEFGQYEREQLVELAYKLDIPVVELKEYKVHLGPPQSLADIIEEDTTEVTEDEPPELSAEPAKSELGQIYALGDHRLMCGDATKTEDVERLMDGKLADMVFTDPPYNVDYGSSKNPRHKIRSIENDSMDSEAWLNFCNDFMSNIRDFNKGDIYMWGASGPEGMRMRLWLVDMGAHWSATIIWKKQQLVLSPAKYQRLYEPCFYGWFDKSSYRGTRKEVEVWDIDRPLNSKEHPTMKPIALCAKGINNSSRPRDIILDIFGGSGSTLIASHQLERTCYMLELDPQYCDVIRKRYWKFINNDNEEGWEDGTPQIT